MQNCRKVCAVYARVSTDMQGESPTNQITLAKEYILRLGDEFVIDDDCIYQDVDESGYYTRFLDRAAIRKALEDASSRRFDVILFKELARISRDQAEHIELVTRFTQNGVRVIAINDNLDSDRPETLDLLGMHSVMSELESKRISSRVSSGKKAMARRGFWVGEAPIGYKVNPATKKLEVDEAFSNIPQTIFHLYITEGYGTFKIASYLNDHGLLTKKGSLWSRVTVSRVLKNPAYAGDLIYGRSRNTLERFYDDSGYRKRRARNYLPKEEWVIHTGTHPPLVSRETFEKAQAILDGRSKQNPRRSKHPLTGILVCGHCKAGMVCQTMRFRKKSGEQVHYRYYVCSTAFKFGRSRCPQPNLNALNLETALAEFLFSHLHGLRGVFVATLVDDSQSALDQERRRIERHQRRIENALSRLLEKDDLPAESRERIYREYLHSLHRVQDEIDRIKAQTRLQEGCGEQRFHLGDYLEALKKQCTTDADVRREFFHALIANVVVLDKKVQQLQLNYHFSL